MQDGSGARVAPEMKALPKNEGKNVPGAKYVNGTLKSRVVTEGSLDVAEVADWPCPESTVTDPSCVDSWMP